VRQSRGLGPWCPLAQAGGETEQGIRPLLIVVGRSLFLSDGCNIFWAILLACENIILMQKNKSNGIQILPMKVLANCSKLQQYAQAIKDLLQ